MSTPTLSKKETPRQFALALLKGKYHYFRDTDNDRTYFALRNVATPFEYKEFTRTDNWMNTWCMDLERMGFKTSPRFVEEVIRTADASRDFRMVTAQLDYLAEHYDGQDHLAQLIATVNTADNALFGNLFRKWLVAVVAQVYTAHLPNPERNDNAFVFVGKQGNGKTGFFERLLWNDEYFVSSATAFDFKNKEHMLMLTTHVLILLDEMSSYSSKTDVNDLKAAFSQKKITAAPKYKETATFRRIGSFAGTTNRTDFLRDDTGDRRFLAFQLEDYDQPAYNKVDKNQLWGQLVTMYRAGFVYKFSQEEIAETILRNLEKHSLLKREDNFIYDMLHVSGDPKHFITVRDMMKLADAYDKDASSKSFGLSMSSIRAKLGLLGVLLDKQKKVDGRNTKVYGGVCLRADMPHSPADYTTIGEIVDWPEGTPEEQADSS